VTINVNISSVSAGVTFDVNISNSAVTLNVNITGSTVTLNVSVEGTASVSIDNATVYLNVQNAKNTGGASTFDNTANADTLLDNYAGYGIYVRNMYGGLLGIRLKVKELSGTNQTLTVGLAINPLSPSLLDVTINVPANTDGLSQVAYVFSKWWNYDTMFVFIKENNPNVQVYAESGKWGTYAYRHYSRGYNSIDYAVGMFIGVRGSSFNTIPVSGTVNTINIPNTASKTESGSTAVSAGATATLATLIGCGRLKSILCTATTHLATFYIYIDGNLWTSVTIDGLNGNNVLKERAGWRLLRYDTTNDEYHVDFVKEVGFKNIVEIKVKNSALDTKYFVGNIYAEVIK